jgi:diguanylate cyclase (GGDEF)-like protein
VLGVDVAVLSVAAIAMMHGPHTATSTLRLVLLAALALGYALAVDHISLLRRYLQLGDRHSSVWSNQTSIWTFAGALVLPLGYASALVLVIYAHILLRGWQNKSIRTYRVVFAIATTLLGVDAAAAVRALAGSPGLSTTAAGAALDIAQLAAYTLVSLAAAVIGLRLYGGRSTIRQALPVRRAVGTELTTLLLGVVTAELASRDLALAPVVIVMAIALHRSSLVGQLQAAASTDAKTGLLNPAAWRTRATEALELVARTGGRGALLMIDLDHFKLINDAHGHLAGDVVLAAVGETLRVEPRKYDIAGRFGGEEFVVLLPGADATTAAVVAERLRVDIGLRAAAHGTPVSASIGAALYFGAADLDDVLHKADLAVYAAKAGGRNRVVVDDSPPVLARPAGTNDVRAVVTGSAA